jgi:hypothetical protein
METYVIEFRIRGYSKKHAKEYNPKGGFEED